MFCVDRLEFNDDFACLYVIHARRGLVSTSEQKLARAIDVHASKLLKRCVRVRYRTAAHSWAAARHVPGERSVWLTFDTNITAAEHSV
jgi:hypothetical protein